MAPRNNRKSIAFVRELARWPSIDLSDPHAISERAEKYFDLCDRYDSKPLISGFCSAIGTNRIEVLSWAQGRRTGLGEKLSPESASELQKYLATFEVLWESAFANDGYRNPVTGIFLGKNNFAYKDTSETIVKHEQTAQGPSRAALEAKYRASIPAEDVKVLPPDDAGAEQGS